MSWIEWSLRAEADGGWSHHGLAVLADGSLLAYHPAERRLLSFDGVSGILARSVECDAVEAHAIVPDGANVWIADCGHKLARDETGEYDVTPPLHEAVGRVLLVDPLTGATVGSIDRPEHPAYAAGGLYLPTSIAVDERGLWIADGYGSNLVHLVSQAGDVVVTIDGFDCPHGILVDRRGAEPLLYVAERGRNRLSVFDLDGGLVRHVAAGELRAPCSMAIDRYGRMFVSELLGRVTVLDEADQICDRIGDATGDTRGPGWPNVAPSSERFLSPHGIAVGDDALFVSEWLLGGRWVRLAVAPSRP